MEVLVVVNWLVAIGCTLAVATFAWGASLPLLGVGIALAMLLVMAFAGVALFRRVLPAEQSPLAVLVFGTVTGLLAGRICLATAGAVFGLSGGSVVLALGTLSALALVLRPRQGFLPSWGDDDQQDGKWLLTLFAVMMLAIAASYWGGGGRYIDGGYAFVPYFGKDYMNHVSVTAELARDIPPQNPYFAGERLHYYWFFHVWPAALASLNIVTAREALVSTIAPTVLLFIGALYLLVRTYVPTRAGWLFGIGIGLFAPSYIGLVFLTKYGAPWLFALIPNHTHIEFSGISHSWFRDFLYEPHAVTALTLLLLALYLDRREAGSPNGWCGAVQGAALGSAAVTDAFIGMIGLCWFGATHAWPLLRRKESRGPIFLTAAVAAALLGAAVGLGVFPVGGRPMDLWVHPMAKLSVAYFTADLGPLFLLGVAGLYMLVVRRRLRLADPVCILLGLSLLFAFSIKVPLETDIALRKGLKVAQISLVVFTAGSYTWLAWTSRLWTWLCVGGLLLPGVLTFGTDVYHYMDATYRRVPPVTFVSREQMKAYEWIRDNTPRETVIQVVSEVRPGRKYLTTGELFIPALAERRTLFCNYELPYLFQVPLAKINARKEVLERLFTAKDPSGVYQALEDLPPHYLYVDESEPGPLSTIRELETCGILEEVCRFDKISLKVFHPSPHKGAGSLAQPGTAAKVTTP